VRSRLARSRKTRAELLAGGVILGVSAIWGATFVIVKDTVATWSVTSFLFWRFLVALVALVAIWPRSLRRIDRSTLTHGLALGAFLSVGYLAQTAGLETTSAATSGFLTSLYVVEAPLLAALATRRRPSSRTFGALGLALVGLAVISLHGLSFRTGDVLGAVGSLAFASQIAGLGAWSQASDPVALTVVQLAVVSATSALALAPSGFRLPPTAADWASVLATGLLATTLALAAQTWAQRRLSTTRASLLMASEPLFATAGGVLGGEGLPFRVVIGGAAIVLAIVAEVKGTSAAETSASETRTGDRRRRFRRWRLYTR
jgi:drug/metabolite transporter (DMT)-like permease